MFDKLFSSLGRLVGAPAQSEGSQLAEEERRIWIRYPCSVQVNCQSPASPHNEAFSAQVMNISRAGIGLWVNRQLEPGQFLSVELPTPSPEGVSRVLAYVLHASPQPDQRWIVGCSFSAELDDNDLAAFGARRVKPEQNDQRNWVRFACPVQASYQYVRGGESAHRPARVVDISPTGIGLQVPRPMEVGSLLSVEMRGSGEERSLTMLASVVRVTEQRDGDWTLGCTFIRELEAKEMEMLL